MNLSITEEDRKLLLWALRMLYEADKSNNESSMNDWYERMENKLRKLR